MPKLPRPTGAEMVRFLEGQGFRVVRIRGSHNILVKGELRTTIPVHGSQNMCIGTLRGVLRDIEMSPLDFEIRWGAE